MKSLPGILIGIAAGVLLGALVAPRSGKDTRKRIAKDTDSFFSDLQDQLQAGLETIKNQYNDFVESTASVSKEAIDRAKK